MVQHMAQHPSEVRVAPTVGNTPEPKAYQTAMLQTAEQLCHCTLSRGLPGGLPVGHGRLQVRLQGCKVWWCCTGSHGAGAAVLLNVLGQAAQPGGAG